MADKVLIVEDNRATNDLLREFLAAEGFTDVQYIDDTLGRPQQRLAAGEMDQLASFYAEDMIFALPGQTDVLDGRPAFRASTAASPWTMP